MTNNAKPKRTRSKPALTGSERQAKHRRTHQVHMVALKQQTVDLLRALRQQMGCSNNALVLDGLHALLARHGLQVKSDAHGSLAISQGRTVSGTNQPRRAKGSTATADSEPARMTTDNEARVAGKGTAKSKSPSPAALTDPAQADLFL